METRNNNFGYEHENSKARKKRKLFTEEEDEIITQMVKRHGPKYWTFFASYLKNRTARQIRERWMNYLSPCLSITSWTKEEEGLLLRLMDSLGHSWSKMSLFFPNKTEMMLKNRAALIDRRRKKENGVKTYYCNKNVIYEFFISKAGEDKASGNYESFIDEKFDQWGNIEIFGE